MSHGGKTGAALTEKQRSALAHPLEMYSFRNYLAYILYPPLYIAGPIMTFNDFMWQVRFPISHSPLFYLPAYKLTCTHRQQHRRPTPIPARTVLRYVARLAFSLLTMELILHCMYVVAIKDAKAWAGDSPFELSLVGWWNLIVVWLKVRFLSSQCALSPQPSIREGLFVLIFTSFSSPGASFACGLSRTGSTPRRTWCGA